MSFSTYSEEFIRDQFWPVEHEGTLVTHGKEWPQRAGAITVAIAFFRDADGVWAFSAYLGYSPHGSPDDRVLDVFAHGSMLPEPAARGILDEYADVLRSLVCLEDVQG